MGEEWDDDSLRVLFLRKREWAWNGRGLKGIERERNKYYFNVSENKK